VIQFAKVVGDAFQAQIGIALVNTIMTALGLWILGIHPIALLATVVFFCGLIPVLGVFISSAPILILAFNIGGLKLFTAALVMISIVHAIEAYILNPRIYSAVFKINPVFTLAILYIGHTLFGMWGVLLGVPISVYIYRHIIIGPNGKKVAPPLVAKPEEEYTD
jgi:predicted PurR-regulated permease PerM